MKNCLNFKFSISFNFYKEILIIAILCFIVFKSKSQSLIVDDPDMDLTTIEKEQLRIKRVDYTSNKIGVVVNVPKDFTLINETVQAPKDGTAVHYAFMSKDSLIFITVGLIPRDSIAYQKSRATFKMFMPSVKNYEPNEQWVFNFKGTADSTEYKPKLFESNTLKKFNAEAGVEFKSKISTDLYLGKYLRERSIILNKKFKGIVEIHFFKLQNSKTNIASIVNEAYKFIKYK